MSPNTAPILRAWVAQQSSSYLWGAAEIVRRRGPGHVTALASIIVFLDSKVRARSDRLSLQSGNNARYRVISCHLGSPSLKSRRQQKATGRLALRCQSCPDAAIATAADSAPIQFGNAISTGAAALPRSIRRVSLSHFLFMFGGPIRRPRCRRPARPMAESKCRFPLSPRCCEIATSDRALHLP
jgi:hypothetical protein